MSSPSALQNVIIERPILSQNANGHKSTDEAIDNNDNSKQTNIDSDEIHNTQRRQSEQCDDVVPPAIRVKQMENFSILHALKNCSTGQYLLKEYNTNDPPSLSERSSKQLCKVIVDHVVKDNET